MPEIRRILLFGSLASGIPTPASDADVLVEVDRSSHREARDRIPEFLGAFSPLPCAVDVFIYTGDEIRRLRAAGSTLIRVADAGILLFERK